MNMSKGSISELKVVDKIVDAIGITIHEPPGPETVVCLTHGVEFLEDHLRRLYKLEENSELLDILVHVHPELETELLRLQQERDTIRAEAHRLVLALEDRNTPSDKALHEIMCELRRLIGEILKHEHHERAVILDAVNIDQGGEG